MGGAKCQEKGKMLLSLTKIKTSICMGMTKKALKIVDRKLPSIFSFLIHAVIALRNRTLGRTLGLTNCHCLKFVPPLKILPIPTLKIDFYLCNSCYTGTKPKRREEKS